MEKVVKDGFFIILSTRCTYLSSDNTCLCYNERFKKNKRCRKVNIFRASFSRYLPPTCAYVLWAKRHHIRFRCELEMVIEDGSAFS